PQYWLMPTPWQAPRHRLITNRRTEEDPHELTAPAIRTVPAITTVVANPRAEASRSGPSLRVQTDSRRLGSKDWIPARRTLHGDWGASSAPSQLQPSRR